MLLLSRTDQMVLVSETETFLLFVGLSVWLREVQSLRNLETEVFQSRSGIRI